MGKYIQYEESEKGYGIIRLNRPEKHHAISAGMANELNGTIKNIHIETISFLVIESSGSTSFCAGGDLYEYHGDLTEDEAFEKLSVMMQVLRSIILFPLPVIALLDGNAFGGGCELATACDFRIAKEGTQFGFVQSNIGILPGWGGGAILYRKVHSAQAFHWITTGEILPVEQLKDMGWIHQIVPSKDWDNKDNILTYYTSKSMEQMVLLKEQYLSQIHTSQLLTDMEKEVKACATLWESEAHQQHVQAFMER